MRPKLKDGVRPLRRPPSAVQFGLDPERAVVFDGLEPAEFALVCSLDGTRDTAELLRAGESVGIPSTRVERLLALLHRAGLLDDAASAIGLLARLDVAARDRLRPDLAAWALLGGTDGGTSVLQRRARARVLVVGAARLGVTVARLLAGAAVGLVEVEDETPVRAADTFPGAYAASHIGANRAVTARVLVAGDSPLPPDARPHRLQRPRWDLVVLAPEGPPDPRVAARLVRHRVPHLLVTVRETSGVVGPLVVPGHTACLHCLDLTRTARDRAWPSLAVQLCGDRRTACGDGTLATASASLAAMQALALLDSGPDAVPACDATLEVRLPHGAITRRSWWPHPACPCGADRARHGDPADAGPSSGAAGADASPSPVLSPAAAEASDARR